MAIADVHAAGEADPTVGDQDLAVVAQIEVQGRRDEPSAFRNSPTRTPRFARSLLILRDSEYHSPKPSMSTRTSTPRRDRPCQGVDEAVTGGVGLEDVGRQVQRLLRPRRWLRASPGTPARRCAASRPGCRRPAAGRSPPPTPGRALRIRAAARRWRPRPQTGKAPRARSLRGRVAPPTCGSRVRARVWMRLMPNRK